MIRDNACVPQASVTPAEPLLPQTVTQVLGGGGHRVHGVLWGPLVLRSRAKQTGSRGGKDTWNSFFL